MPERKPFNEYAAEHILGATAEDVQHQKFGAGRRFPTSSGRVLDVFDGAVGINGRGLQLLVDRQDLTTVFTADSIGFEGTVNGIPLSMTFRGDTGEVVFENTTSPATAELEEEATPPPEDVTTSQAAAEPGAERGKDVSFTGRLFRQPRISTRGDVPQVKLSVAEHREGTDGKEETIWHDVWPDCKLPL